LKIGILLVFMVCLLIISCGQDIKMKDELILKLMESKPELFSHILEKAQDYEIQVMYTQIDRDSNNVPSFTPHILKAKPGHYFYPASSIKLYAAVLALQKINQLKIDGLDKFTPLRIDSISSGQSAVEQDTTSENRLPSIAHYIKKVFLVSDNDAYNRLYEFTGQQALNEGLWQRGFSNTRILHRLSVRMTAEQNRYSNPFTFYRGDKIIYQQTQQYNADDYSYKIDGFKRGRAHYADGRLINEPMDFSLKNYSLLEELQGVLKAVLFPEAAPAAERFELTDNDYNFLLKYMSMLPKESSYPEYDMYDSYCKFFMFGASKEKMPANIRIFNKVGDAYGQMIDNAYIVDFENRVEFLLTAVIYVNENQTLNDNKYEYDQIGMPFMADLGRTVYEYELSRERAHLPDLTKFKMDYSD